MNTFNRDKLFLGCSPASELCAQVGQSDYSQQARRECRAWIAQLRRVFGPEPAGAQLAISSNEHDFGTYLDVVCWFERDNPAAIEYAYRVEANQIFLWDEQARSELGLPHEEV